MNSKLIDAIKSFVDIIARDIHSNVDIQITRNNDLDCWQVHAIINEDVAMSAYLDDDIGDFYINVITHTN